MCYFIECLFDVAVFPAFCDDALCKRASPPNMGKDNYQPATGAEHEDGSRPYMPSINMRDNLGRNKQ